MSINKRSPLAIRRRHLHLLTPFNEQNTLKAGYDLSTAEATINQGDTHMLSSCVNNHWKSWQEDYIIII